MFKISHGFYHQVFPKNWPNSSFSFVILTKKRNKKCYHIFCLFRKIHVYLTHIKLRRKEEEKEEKKNCVPYGTLNFIDHIVHSKVSTSSGVNFQQHSNYNSNWQITVKEFLTHESDERVLNVGNLNWWAQSNFPSKSQYYYIRILKRKRRRNKQTKRRKEKLFVGNKFKRICILPIEWAPPIAIITQVWYGTNKRK